MKPEKLNLIIKGLLSDRDFQDYVRHIFDTSGVLSGIHSNDPTEIAREAGRQSVGLELLHELADLDTKIVANILSRGNEDE